MRELAIDLETKSREDIKASGMHRYARHRDFGILLFGYEYSDNEGVRTCIDRTNGEEISDQLKKDLLDPTIKKTAYNAPFEMWCIEQEYGIELDPTQWECTRIKAAMLGLPLALDKVAQVLKLEQQKMSEGKALIKLFTVPQSAAAMKKNGGKEWITGEDEPEKWETFKQYNLQDIATETAIRKKIAFFNIPPQEMELWYFDYRMNARGICLDEDFYERAITIYEENQIRMLDETQEITGVMNPNSAAQLKKWLSDMLQTEVTKLTKGEVETMLSMTEIADVRKVLKLRQQIAKSSIKKYFSMRKVICDDGRARGLIQFYGANRTGRFAGRLIQVQNLIKNFLKDLGLARQIVKEDNLNILEMMFGNVPDTLAQLIRTAFVPSEGMELYIADYSAIEAVVIAWLAQEMWRLEVFTTHGKIYEASASKMFKVSMDSISYKDEAGNKCEGPNYEMRASGKVAELACCAFGQMVDTDKGAIPIQEITLEHRLWDGFDFVNHDGLVYKGIKNVITYDGLTATPDHLVWVEGQTQPIQFGIAAATSLKLQRSGIDRANVWLGRNNFRRKTLAKRLERPNGTYQMQRVRKRPMVEFLRPEKRQVQGMPKLLTTSSDSEMVGSKVNSSKTKMRKSERQGVSTIWRSRDRISFRFGTRSRYIPNQGVWIPDQRFGAGQKRQQRALREGQRSFCKSARQSRQQENIPNTILESKRMALLSFYRDKNGYIWPVENPNIRKGPRSCFIKTKKLATDSGEVKVYDILNAGPRNRFSVNGVLVHNCGYQGGPNALLNMGALAMGVCDEAIRLGQIEVNTNASEYMFMSEAEQKEFLKHNFIEWNQTAKDHYVREELQGIIDVWRSENKAIVNFWYKCQNAAIECVMFNKTVVIQFGITFFMDKGVLFVKLPSGRCLSYMRPKLKKNKWDKWSLTYEGLEQKTNTWRTIDIYGGKFAENLVQAIARDCLAVAMLKLDKKGYRIVMHVHDEVVIEHPKGEGVLKDILDTMCEDIPWAPGLPLRAAGYVSSYYKKD